MAAEVKSQEPAKPEQDEVKEALENLQQNYKELLARYSDYDAKTRQTIRWYVGGAFILGCALGYAVSFL